PPWVATVAPGRTRIGPPLTSRLPPDREILFRSIRVLLPTESVTVMLVMPRAALARSPTVSPSEPAPRLIDNAETALTAAMLTSAKCEVAGEPGISYVSPNAVDEVAAKVAVPRSMRSRPGVGSEMTTLSLPALDSVKLRTLPGP